MKTLEQQILSCMTVRLTEQFPALAPAFFLLSFQESENMEMCIRDRPLLLKRPAIRLSTPEVLSTSRDNTRFFMDFSPRNDLSVF